VFLGVSLAALLVLLLVDYKFLVDYAYYIYGFVMAVLAVMVVFNHLMKKGSWIRLRYFQVQPSELAKIALVLVMGRLFSEYKRSTLTRGAALAAGGLAAVPFFLVALQPDLGTAVSLLSILAGALILAGLERRTLIAVAVLLTAPLVLPLNVGYRGGTLDGLAFLNTAQPGDAAAIRYLSTLNGDEVIVEAVKGDYEYYSRISAFTGIPAVIGSPFHEFTWRGGDAGVMARVADVKIMYEDPSRRSDLAQKYHATLLYVGDPERVLYPSMDLSGGGLTPLYDAGGVTIYRFTG
jgi:cell division protein FtsW (lipid II flippase)